MSNVIINPTSDAAVIALGEHVQLVSRAKELWYTAVKRALAGDTMSNSRAYHVATMTLKVNGFDFLVIQDALREIYLENKPA